MEIAIIKTARTILLKLAYPALKKIGKLHSPWTHKKITAEHVEQAYDSLKRGDIMLSRTFGELTNLCIPSGWKHAALYHSRGWIIEAKDPKVRITNIYDFMMTKDFVAIVRPRVNEIVRAGAAAAAESAVDKPYDYYFDMPKDKPNTAFYCAELPYWCYKTACPKFPFELRSTMGVPTVTPDDYVKAEKLFEIVWTNG